MFLDIVTSSLLSNGISFAVVLMLIFDPSRIMTTMAAGARLLLEFSTT
jgi:hypothetical protein